GHQGRGRSRRRRQRLNDRPARRIPPRSTNQGHSWSWNAMQPRLGHGPLYTHLYFQVLVAIAIGVILGALAPSLAIAMKPLGDGFIKLIKMMIAPIIFTTVVVGIAKVGDMKEVGRVGLKALIYFEVLTTVALAIGLLVANVIQPGAGINANPNAIDPKSVASYTAAAQH